MVLAVLEVDPQNDWVDYLNLCLAGLGAFAAAIAIVIARRAEKKADQAVADERRRVFEMEALRDLMKDLDETDIAAQVFHSPERLSRYRFRLNLLSTKLEFWELTMALQDKAAVIDAVGVGQEYRVAVAEQDEANQGRADSWPEWSFLNEESIFRDRPERQDPVRLLELTAYRERLDETEQAAEQRVALLVQDAEAKFRKRLAWDLEQAILARVEARKPGRLRWWHRTQ